MFGFGTRSFGKKQKQYYSYVNKDWKLSTPPRVDLMLVIYMYMFIDLQPDSKAEYTQLIYEFYVR